MNSHALIDVHPEDRACRTPAPVPATDRAAALALAGIATGVAAAELIGWVMGAPGIRLVFGL